MSGSHWRWPCRTHHAPLSLMYKHTVTQILNIFKYIIYACDGKAEFSEAITIFDVTWSFRNHSNMLNWNSRNITFYHQCWKQLCYLIFILFKLRYTVIYIFGITRLKIIIILLISKGALIYIFSLFFNKIKYKKKIHSQASLNRKIIDGRKIVMRMKDQREWKLSWKLKHDTKKNFIQIWKWPL